MPCDSAPVATSPFPLPLYLSTSRSPSSYLFPCLLLSLLSLSIEWCTHTHAHARTHRHTHVHTHAHVTRRGAAFGLSHSLGQLVALRPANRHPALPNLYFVGASTSPGNGVPLVLTGAAMVARRILADSDDSEKRTGLEGGPARPSFFGLRF